MTELILALISICFVVSILTHMLTSTKFLGLIGLLLLMYYYKAFNVILLQLFGFYLCYRCLFFVLIDHYYTQNYNNKYSYKEQNHIDINRIWIRRVIRVIARYVHRNFNVFISYRTVSRINKVFRNLWTSNKSINKLSSNRTVLNRTENWTCYNVFLNFEVLSS